MADVSFFHDGSMYGFTAHTKAAKDWFYENVQSEGWQWLENTLYLDSVKYACDLLIGIAEARLTVS